MYAKECDNCSRVYDKFHLIYESPPIKKLYFCKFCIHLQDTIDLISKAFRMQFFNRTMYFQDTFDATNEFYDIYF